jgi:hypothetical protein
LGGDAVRQTIKQALQTLLQNTPGIKAVNTYRRKLDNRFPIITIYLPKSDETRASASAPLGKKFLKFTAQLEIFTIDQSTDGSGQLEFDDLLDAVDQQLRSDVTLGGTVLASTIEFIKTNVSPPMLVNGQNVALLAVKQFDITVQVTG